LSVLIKQRKTQQIAMKKRDHKNKLAN